MPGFLHTSISKVLVLRRICGFCSSGLVYVEAMAGVVSVLDSDDITFVSMVRTGYVECAVRPVGFSLELE